MADKGFFEGLIDDFFKILKLRSVVEWSKDEKGKPDPAKATGIAMGLGSSSFEDLALMNAMLATDGAFDGDKSDNGSDDDDSDSLFSDDTSDSDHPEFEDTQIGVNNISADDMELLSDAGYDEFDLEYMSPEELADAMDEAGVDTDYYDFDF